MSKRGKCDEITKCIFSKNAETAHRASSAEAAYSEHSISMAGYITAIPAFVCFELPAREATPGSRAVSVIFEN